jgi:hypothetical protein
MSRKTIGALVCGVVVLCSAFIAIRISHSNDRELSVDESDDPVTTKQGVQKNRGAHKAAGRQQSVTLQQQFVTLSTKRAQRMSDEELGAAVEQLTKELADQDTAAEVELEKAVEQLKEIAAKFPGTPAAERASLALQAIETVKIRPRQNNRARQGDFEDSLGEDVEPFSDEQ